MTILNKKLPNKALLASALFVIIKAAAKNCSLLLLQLLYHNLKLVILGRAPSQILCEL